MEANTIYTIVLPVVGLIIFILLIFLFKDRLSALEFDPRKLKLRAEFVQGVKDLEQKAQEIKTTDAAGRLLSDSQHVIDFSVQSPRDKVIEAFGALKQNIFSACTVNQLELSPSSGVLDAVGLLRDAGAVNAEIAFLLKVLYNLGQKIAGSKIVALPTSQAASYIKSVLFVVDWIKDNILTPPKVDPPPPPPPPRQTVVGEHYVQPKTGQPTTWLIGTEGPVRGRRFPVDRSHYRIGSKAGNHLCIKDDDYVSGDHAYLRYEKGSLYLVDQGSRNGTFLNSQPVAHMPLAVRNGDYIQIGESVLQVSETAAAQDSAPHNKGQSPKAVRDPTWVE